MPGMTTAREIRHANLLRLIEEFGSIQALADRLGKSHSQISQLRNQVVHSTTGKQRVVGDKLAREIEQKLGRPEGWMDQLHRVESVRKVGDGRMLVVDTAVMLERYSPPPTSDEIQLLADLRELLPEDREHFAAEIRVRAEQMRRHTAYLLEKHGHPVPDHKVAEHLPPAPWDGRERRHEDVAVPVERRESWLRDDDQRERGRRRR